MYSEKTRRSTERYQGEALGFPPETLFNDVHCRSSSTSSNLSLALDLYQKPCGKCGAVGRRQASPSRSDNSSGIYALPSDRLESLPFISLHLILLLVLSDDCRTNTLSAACLSARLSDY